MTQTKTDSITIDIPTLPNSPVSYPLMFIPTPKSYISSCSNNRIQILKPASAIRIKSQPCQNSEIPVPVSYDTSISRLPMMPPFVSNVNSRLIFNDANICESHLNQHQRNTNSYRSPILTMQMNNSNVLIQNREETARPSDIQSHSSQVFNDSDFRVTAVNLSANMARSASAVKLKPAKIQNIPQEQAKYNSEVDNSKYLVVTSKSTLTSAVGRVLVLVALLFLIYIIIK